MTFSEYLASPSTEEDVELFLTDLTDHWEVVGGIECVVTVNGVHFNYLIRPGDPRLHSLDLLGRHGGFTRFKLIK